MGMQVVMGASLMCTQGVAPSTLIVTPQNKTLADGKPAANIMDNKPIANIPPFGMCRSLANPTVAAATSAALGVLTPMPCIPVIPAPWAPGSPTVLIGNQPALNNSSKCMCAYAGTISITNPGSTTVQIP
ncbi:DUF4280 domain-containing protein [Agaribacter marinus]|uniref:DUF4280 domain-containing protein n=1 Tax=Agaribacter marinus TaxID=1431249 RepID=A0AA37WLC4_9ALTE|nr:DUF4280 domain-containing protein [Agaribacter marinus]GLR71900.1 hypothetical protein GCM10007852_28080 [Agaribacter marinus]